MDIERETKKMSGERKRTVTLTCPSILKTTKLIIYDNYKIDIGSISRVFGLDPASVKINGHFISRGPDLVSSSVMWRSLISFFSSRGLSTGDSESGALVVDGKLCKPGTKRAQELDDTDNEIYYSSSIIANLRIQLGDINLVKNKKLKGNSSEYIDRNDQVNIDNGFSLKRKRQQEDFFPLKRLTIK